MAYTATLTKKTVFGDERVQQYIVTADAASGTVATGLGNLSQIHWSAKSIATGATPIRVRMNANAAGTASLGTVGVSGCASGDEFYLTVYGR